MGCALVGEGMNRNTATSGTPSSGRQIDYTKRKERKRGEMLVGDTMFLSKICFYCLKSQYSLQAQFYHGRFFIKPASITVQ